MSNILIVRFYDVEGLNINFLKYNIEVVFLSSDVHWCLLETYVIICIDNEFSPVRHQANIWTNAIFH